MNEKNDALENFTWCALVALKIARIDNRIHSSFSEHIFIFNWLVVAKKRKLFSKLVAQDIDWLLMEGRSKGVNANLKFKIEYLRSVCCKKLVSQSVLFRFTRAFENLKLIGWEGYFIALGKWNALLNAEINTPGNFIYISEQKVRECFGKNGALLCQLKLRVCGDVQTAEQVFNDNGLILDIEQHTELNQTFFVLRPEKNTMACEDLS
ncbi:DUF2913 family protein [Salmonella enterica subsp. enterica serovar Javiana]|uniref:DUF2913 family protein n=1 Tax=Salmonella enterica TaxID=28901 RepID=A0A5U5BZX5_SALER|nr:DUF2913 family protein [Salmonella enterica]EAB5446073.1 DUF2913 family protein [Salmonella enterica subsp. enterica serovar Braenderup]EBP3480385.1 DUF2913 family protein [Salmonella enterica subsp. enterica]EBW1762106.1 DUF2913 family protein [Salmonella enterica subsp. enterica serovar Infantis]EDF7023675.1 DUF2913 family protein [Salmonella enterica subsp. enterica serovar Muenchen]EAB3661034.1 DUF2913 family protein [Salmonella enterica]